MKHPVGALIKQQRGETARLAYFVFATRLDRRSAFVL